MKQYTEFLAAALLSCLLTVLLATTASANPVDKKTAARFLSHASLGADYATINQVANSGLSAWIEQQMALPASLHMPLAEQYIAYGAALSGIECESEEDCEEQDFDESLDQEEALDCEDEFDTDEECDATLAREFEFDEEQELDCDSEFADQEECDEEFADEFDEEQELDCEEECDEELADEFDEEQELDCDPELADEEECEDALAEELIEDEFEGPFAITDVHRFIWWHHALSAPDQLRQRVALALSEIFVVSDRVDILMDTPVGLASYYDVLVNHAFANYRDLLLAVTLHPAMGEYLSHVNNPKSDPSIGRYPDENYAREVMQLFSIGLYELNTDGSRLLNASGNPIATYDNNNITEFAKIFTGLSFGGETARFGNEDDENRQVPMVMFDEYHEQGPKQLLLGQTVPAGQTGMQDIEAAIDNLFHHPNVGPFIAKHLIQRLTTSNPSPAYVQRVAEVFNNNSQQVRGDLGAVVKAILLDPEVEASNAQQNPSYGKLREPLIRYVSLLRAFNTRSESGLYFIAGHREADQLKQHALNAPSVFNFFSPAYQPNGEISDAGLVAPEMQIITDTSIVKTTNLMREVLFDDFIAEIALTCIDEEEPCPAGFAAHQVKFDLSNEIALADDIPALLERLDLLLAYGKLSDAFKQSLSTVLAQIEQAQDRVRMAIYLIMISPEQAVND